MSIYILPYQQKTVLLVVSCAYNEQYRFSISMTVLHHWDKQVQSEFFLALHNNTSFVF